MKSIILAIFVVILACGVPIVTACPDYCPYIYDPVCAGLSDGSEATTFANDCLLSSYNCIYGSSEYEIQMAFNTDCNSLPIILQIT